MTHVARYGEIGPGPKGSVMTVNFELDGQEFIALNGGPHFKFTEAISLFVNCDTQEEVDELWTKLTAGGNEGQCGWLKDKFGLSWQIVPAAFFKLAGDKDPEKSKRVFAAMLQMKKMDIARLEHTEARSASEVHGRSWLASCFESWRRPAPSLDPSAEVR